MDEKALNSLWQHNQLHPRHQKNLPTTGGSGGGSLRLGNLLGRAGTALKSGHHETRTKVKSSRHSHPFQRRRSRFRPTQSSLTSRPLAVCLPLPAPLVTAKRHSRPLRQSKQRLWPDMSLLLLHQPLEQRLWEV